MQCAWAAVSQAVFRTGSGFFTRSIIRAAGCLVQAGSRVTFLPLSLSLHTN